MTPRPQLLPTCKATAAELEPDLLAEVDVDAAGAAKPVYTVPAAPVLAPASPLVLVELIELVVFLPVGG